MTGRCRRPPPSQNSAGCESWSSLRPLVVQQPPRPPHKAAQSFVRGSRASTATSLPSAAPVPKSGDREARFGGKRAGHGSEIRGRRSEVLRPECPVESRGGHDEPSNDFSTLGYDVGAPERQVEHSDSRRRFLMMEQPWRIEPDGSVHEVDVGKPDAPPGDWEAVEQWLGVRLPTDYKALVGDGPARVFDEELVIASPFDPGHNDLVSQIRYGSWSLATLRQDYGGDYDVALFPQPGGLLCFGGDGGGGLYYWRTADPNPDRWTVLVSGRPVIQEPGIDYACGLSTYIAGLIDGSIQSESLGDWPREDPQWT